MVFRFKCYNLPFFGWWDGNVDKYSVLIFFMFLFLPVTASLNVRGLLQGGGG